MITQSINLKAHHFAISSLICLIGATMLGFSNWFFQFDNNDFYLMICGVILLGILWLASLMIIIIRNPVQALLNPLCALGLWYFINFGIAAIVHYVAPVRTLSPEPLQTLLPTGVAAAVLGYVSLLAGYALIPKSQTIFDSNVRHMKWLTDAMNDDKALLLLTLVCLVTGWIPRLIKLQRGTFHFGLRTGTPLNLNDPFIASIGLVESLVSIAIVMVVYGAFVQRRRRELFLFIIILGLEFAWGIFSGSKAAFLWPALWAFCSWYAFIGTRHTKRTFTIIGGMFLLVLLIFPFFNAYRAVSFRADDPLEAWRQAYTSVFTASDSLISSSADSAIQRIDGIVPVSMVIRYTPTSWNYQYGYTFASALLSPIPRFLWPGKPLPINKIAFGADYYIKHPNSVNTASTPTSLGEFYLNFGWFGIIFGMMVYGIAVRLSWEWYRKEGYSPGALIVFLLMWMSLFRIDILFSSFLGGVPRQIIIILIFLRLMIAVIKPARSHINGGMSPKLSFQRNPLINTGKHKKHFYNR